MKSSHFEGRIALSAMETAKGRDERIKLSLQPFDDRGFGCVVLGHQQPDLVVGFGAQRYWQDAFDGAHSTCWVFVTAQFALVNPPIPYIFGDYVTTRPLRRPSENISARNESTSLCP